MIAVILAVAINCGNAATQLDLNFCAAHASHAAVAREKRAYGRAFARFSSGVDRALVLASELAWESYRRAACDYASAMVRGGSIQPMIDDSCWASLTDQRTDVLKTFGGKTSGAAARASAGSAREEAAIYGKLELLVDPGVRPLLARSEDAWHAYARVACESARPECATTLFQDRIATLKASWLADPFW